MKIKRSASTLVHPVSLVTALLLGGASGGCDDLAQDDTVPRTLAVIQGELRDASPATEGQVAMALFWNELSSAEEIIAPLGSSARTDSAEFSEVTCEDLDVDKQYDDGRPWRSRLRCNTRALKVDELADVVRYEPTFPLRFQIPVTSLPPEAARVDLSKFGGTGSFAFGSVVAFIDADDDGAFDFGAPGQAPEEALASSLVSTRSPGSDVFSNFWVVYLDGSIDLAGANETYRDTLRDIPQGFSLWYKTETPAENPADRPLRERQILSIDETVQLLGDETLRDSSYFCSAYQTEIKYVDAPFEKRYGAFWCDASGLVAEAETTSEAIVVDTCSYQYERVKMSIASLPADDVPSDWPCPLD